jgi:hypothetical protein
MFDFPVNPNFMNLPHKIKKLNFVDQYVSQMNIPVNEKQQIEQQLIIESQKFKFYCQKLNESVKCNYDFKEQFVEKAICQYLVDLDLKNITEKEKFLIFT